jgi:hypothetical protein
VGRNLQLFAPRQYLTGIDFPLPGTQSRMDFIVNIALSTQQNNFELACRTCSERPLRIPWRDAIRLAAGVLL